MMKGMRIANHSARVRRRLMGITGRAGERK
jgi:hypothetical protein